jgi:hypothetical protein
MIVKNPSLTGWVSLTLVNCLPDVCVKGLSTTNDILVVQSQLASRCFLPNLDPRPLAVVSIRLAGISAEGDPAYIIFNQIKEYYEGSDRPAAFVDLSFDYYTKAGFNKYAAQVNKAVKVLQRSVSFELVIITR